MAIPREVFERLTQAYLRMAKDARPVAYNMFVRRDLNP
jgi:hypothetical protein